MRPRFKTLVPSLLFVMAFWAMHISCKPDKNTTTVTKVTKCVTCANGGNCVNDTCVCPAGYEGTSCETVSRQRFLGNWSVSEKGSITEAAQYPVSIIPGTLITDVLIENFYNYFSTPIRASVQGDTIFIPNQGYEGKTVFGIGYIYSSVTYGLYGAINMAYEIVDSATGTTNDFGYNSAVDHSGVSAWNK